MQFVLIPLLSHVPSQLSEIQPDETVFCLLLRVTGSTFLLLCPNWMYVSVHLILARCRRHRQNIMNLLVSDHLAPSSPFFLELFGQKQLYILRRPLIPSNERTGLIVASVSDLEWSRLCFFTRIQSFEGKAFRFDLKISCCISRKM